MSTSTAPPPEPPRPFVRLGAGWWVCVVMVCGGLTWLALSGQVLSGGLLMAAGFVLAAVLRSLHGEERVSALQLRGRGVDVLTYVLFAVAVTTATVLVHLREGA